MITQPRIAVFGYPSLNVTQAPSNPSSGNVTSYTPNNMRSSFQTMQNPRSSFQQNTPSSGNVRTMTPNNAPPSSGNIRTVTPNNPAPSASGYGDRFPGVGNQNPRESISLGGGFQASPQQANASNDDELEAMMKELENYQ